MAKSKAVVKQPVIDSLIYEVRGHKVVLDVDLAELYGVETRSLNQAVKRNADRFPDSFMFALTKEEAREWKLLRSHNVILQKGRHIKHLPHAFTEHGVLMAANVLKSTKAVDVSIQIIEAFVRIKKMLVSHVDLARKVDAMEKKYDKNFKVVFDALRQLIAPSEPKRKQIGFGGKH